ncbi:MAG: SIS domain-containing protein [Gemmatimonadetes bacterium]|nr:SIS domain-containing protein [Gemmatimonadota bacterium]NNM05928.1 SIS domain-containing protein [Gemmatimonadota bacterium]
MNGGEIVRRRLQELKELVDLVADPLGPEIEILAAEVSQVLLRGGKLFFCGNGGSAADAQHLAAEYVIRFHHHRAPMPALALTTDTSVLTAGANDLGFEEVFSRQLEAFGREGDLLFLHSTSGESENLLRAAEVASSIQVKTVGFLARGGGRLASVVDHAVVIPTDSVPRAQEMHLVLGHIICELAEAKVMEGRA